MYLSIVKPFLDFILALIILFIISPIFLIVMILLFIINDGEPFFLQTRGGKNQKIFKIIKFKTMHDDTGEDGKLLSDKKRLTKAGKFLRKTSLDEIPQLINVLKGDMSLIGPRPLLPEYLPLYNEEQKKRHHIKSGITGWAQINGRNAITWKKKLELDVWYVENLSFVLDIKIILKTILKVFKTEGITSKTSATMEGFNGKN